MLKEFNYHLVRKCETNSPFTFSASTFSQGKDISSKNSRQSTKSEVCYREYLILAVFDSPILHSKNFTWKQQQSELNSIKGSMGLIKMLYAFRKRY